MKKNEEIKEVEIPRGLIHSFMDKPVCELYDTIGQEIPPSLVGFEALHRRLPVVGDVNAGYNKFHRSKAASTGKISIKRGRCKKQQLNTILDKKNTAEELGKNWFNNRKRTLQKKICTNELVSGYFLNKIDEIELATLLTQVVGGMYPSLGLLAHICTAILIIKGGLVVFCKKYQVTEKSNKDNEVKINT